MRHRCLWWRWRWICRTCTKCVATFVDKNMFDQSQRIWHGTMKYMWSIYEVCASIWAKELNIRWTWTEILGNCCRMSIQQMSTWWVGATLGGALIAPLKTVRVKETLCIVCVCAGVYCVCLISSQVRFCQDTMLASADSFAPKRWGKPREKRLYNDVLKSITYVMC